MSAVNIPNPRFPNALDDDSTLLRVFDTSESVLARDMKVTDDDIALVPDFDAPEKWSVAGGFVKVGEEDMFYTRTESVYAPSDNITQASQVFISQFDVASFGSPMMVDGFVPGPSTGSTSVTMRGETYTCAGVIRIGNKDIEFAVKGDGPHGDGSTFFVSRPDLVQLPFCSINADAGKLMVSSISFGWSIKSLFWNKPAIGSDGVPVRRISRMYNLLRGMRGTRCSNHAAGEFVRGNIMAEHHSIMASVISAMERLVGTDNSEDRSSQDFRLRDLSDLCVEEDDFGCPDATLNFTVPPVVDNCLVTRTVDLRASIVGDYDRFAIFFGDGTSTSDNLSTTHRYPSGAKVEPYIYAANTQCEVSSGFFESDIEAVQGVPDLPDLVCPDILIPNIPAIPDITLPDFQPSNTQITIINTGPSFSIPSIWISVPNSIWFSPSFPSIYVSMPDFNPGPITIIFDPPPITVVFTVSVNFPPDVGPCFALVPCGTGYHHPGYVH